MVERQSAPSRNPSSSVVPSAMAPNHDAPVGDGFVARNRQFPFMEFALFMIISENSFLMNSLIISYR